MMTSNHLVLCHPYFLLSIFTSIRVFSSESVLHLSWPKYWGFTFRISPPNEYSGWIYLRIDWFDFLDIQGTLKPSAAPQFKSINSSVLSSLYGPLLTFILDSWSNYSFDSKVMSLLFHMLSRFAIAFLPRSKHLLISWLQSPSAVILEPPKLKSVTLFPLFPHLFAMK